jgi:hypothetical protein
LRPLNEKSAPVDAAVIARGSSIAFGSPVFASRSITAPPG